MEIIIHSKTKKITIEIDDLAGVIKIPKEKINLEKKAWEMAVLERKKSLSL